MPEISAVNVTEAIQNAEAILPGVAAPDGRTDPRWQAIIAIAEFIEDSPEPVWAFVERWGQYPDNDLRAAIATGLLEHLLEKHFDLVFPRVERLVRSDSQFAEMAALCWLFGESEIPENACKVTRLFQNGPVSRGPD